MDKNSIVIFVFLINFVGLPAMNQTQGQNFADRLKSKIAMVQQGSMSVSRLVGRYQTDIALSKQLYEKHLEEEFRSSPITKSVFYAIEQNCDKDLIDKLVARARQASPSQDMTKKFENEVMQCSMAKESLVLKNKIIERSGDYKYWMKAELLEAIETLDVDYHHSDDFYKKLRAIKKNAELYKKYVRQGTNDSHEIVFNKSVYFVEPEAPVCRYEYIAE